MLRKKSFVLLTLLAVLWLPWCRAASAGLPETPRFRILGVDQGLPSTRQRELRITSADGSTVWVLMSAAAVRGDHAVNDTEIVAQFEDVTARRAGDRWSSAPGGVRRGSDLRFRGAGCRGRTDDLPLTRRVLYH